MRKGPHGMVKATIYFGLQTNPYYNNVLVKACFHNVKFLDVFRQINEKSIGKWGPQKSPVYALLNPGICRLFDYNIIHRKRHELKERKYKILYFILTLADSSLHIL